MAKVESRGLDRVEEIYQDRTQRVRELRAEGKQVIGYLHIYPVLEMLTALGLVPYSMFGDMREPITRADAALPSIVCRLLRSLLDQGLKGKYGFLDGVVMAHMCEVGEKLAHVWRTYIDLPYNYFIDTPHTTQQAALKHHKEQLKEFKKSLEEFTGKELSPERLKEAIILHNEQRALVRELYDLKKQSPPLISGTETIRVIMALMSLPIEEGTALLRQVINDVEQGNNAPVKKPARLLVWGSTIDTTALIEMIESTGANVVMDNILVGSRPYFADVELTDDHLDGLAHRYLVDLKHPRTFVATPVDSTKKIYLEDLENRFHYVKDYAEEWNANGVVLETMRYCDVYGYDVPALRDYLDNVGLPNTHIEWDYSEAALAPLRTRIQAFVEVVG